MISALFNLIRNGQAHQYQQMRAVLADGPQFRVTLTGAQAGVFLGTALSKGRPSRHLSFALDNGDLWMTVRPDLLFVDLRDSIASSKLLNRGLTFSFISEDRPNTFGFTAAQAESALRHGGH